MGNKDMNKDQWIPNTVITPAVEEQEKEPDWYRALRGLLTVGFMVIGGAALFAIWVVISGQWNGD